jgi:hypothetical protein
MQDRARYPGKAQSAKPSNIKKESRNDENGCQVGEEKCKPGGQFAKENDET